MLLGVRRVSTEITMLRKDDINEMAAKLVSLYKYKFHCEDSDGLHKAVWDDICEALQLIEKNFGNDDLFIMSLCNLLKDTNEGVSLVKNAEIFKKAETKLFN